MISICQFLYYIYLSQRSHNFWYSKQKIWWKHNLYWKCIRYQVASWNCPAELGKNSNTSSFGLGALSYLEWKLIYEGKKQTKSKTELLRLAENCWFVGQSIIEESSPLLAVNGQAWNGCLWHPNQVPWPMCYASTNQTVII